MRLARATRPKPTRSEPAQPKPARPKPTRPKPAQPKPTRSEPTPWATGLTVTAMVAAISAATDLLLTLSLQVAYGWLWIPANVLLGGGLTPSVLLLRKMPTWRWVSYGIVIGFGCAWFGLALGALFGVRA